MFLRCTVPILLFCTSLAEPAHSQNAQDNSTPVPTVKAKVREVLIDVVVTDSKGDPIPGLKHEDFQVFEDAKTQTIRMFVEHKGVAPTQFKLPPMPPNVYTNFPVTQSADSVNIILLDALNTPSSDQSYVHSQMLKYLQTIPPATRVAIFTLASQLRMLQGVTTDSSRLLASINSAKAGPHASPLRPSSAESDANQSRVDFMTSESMAPPPAPNQIPAQYSADPISATKQFLSDTGVFLTEERVGLTLQALQQLARYLSGIPGRKNVIWFSGSFPAGIVPDSELPDPFSGARNFQEEIRQTADLLATAQVALYPIAAEGLVSDTAFQVDNRQIGQKRISVAAQDTMRQSRTTALDLNSSHASMEQLAKETGGQAFYNTNGLNDALTRVVNIGSRYYSLAYSPTNANMDGKYRRIQVKLIAGKGTLSYRRGYNADDVATALAPANKQNADPLLPLMGRNLPDYSQILYKVLVHPTSPQPVADAPRAGTNSAMKGPFTRYGVDFAVTPDDLRLEKSSDDVHHGDIEVMLVAYDSEGKPLNLVVAKNEIRIQPKDYPDVLKGGLQFHQEIDVPAGETFLRTGVYDLKSGEAGTLGVPLRAVMPTGK
jgi:VWFA-related protein